MNIREDGGCVESLLDLREHRCFIILELLLDLRAHIMPLPVLVLDDSPHDLA